MNVRMTPLGKVVAVSAGQPAPRPNEFSESGYPFIRAGSLEKLLNGSTEADCEKISSITAAKYRMKLYPKDTVVFPKSGMSAKIGRVYRLNGSAYLVSHLAALEPTGKYDPSYLVHWLRAHPPSALIKDDAYPSIRTSEVEMLEVPDIPTAEQGRIATILDKSQTICRKREQALTLTEDFLRSAFLEMFGDPFLDDRGFPSTTVENICLLITDCLHTTPNHFDEPNAFPSIRSSELQSGYINLSSAKYVSEAEYQIRIQRYRPSAGDTIYCREGARFGSVGIVPNGMTPCLGQRTMLLKANPELATQEYLWGVMCSDATVRQAENVVGGAASPHVNIKDIRQFKCLLPPLELQCKFTKLCQNVFIQRQRYLDPLNSAKHLFYSLSQRAFRGEL